MYIWITYTRRQNRGNVFCVCMIYKCRRVGVVKVTTAMYLAYTHPRNTKTHLIYSVMVGTPAQRRL